MKNNRTIALLMLLVFLLVVAVVIIFLTGLDRHSTSDNPYENVTVTSTPEMPAETPEPAPTTAPTSAPVYYPPSTAAPVQTAAPVSTAAPASAACSAKLCPSAFCPTIQIKTLPLFTSLEFIVISPISVSCHIHFSPNSSLASI